MEEGRPTDIVRKVIREAANKEKMPVAFIDEESTDGQMRLIAYLSHRDNYVKTSRKTDLAPIDRQKLERIIESIRPSVNVNSIKIQSHFWPKGDHEHLNPNEFHTILLINTNIAAKSHY